MAYRIAYSFDDLLIVPQHSDIESIEKEIDPSTTVGSRELGIPIISAAMDTVTDINMQIIMLKNGGLGIHHRYVREESGLYPRLVDGAFSGPIAISPSMGTKFVDALSRMHKAQSTYPVTVAIDVAHGDRREVLDFAKYCVDGGLEVWSGNIATPGAAKRYTQIGVNVLKVGVGGGAACSTRVVSGCGVPTATSIAEIAKEFPEATIIADGGIKNSGDIVKALALGADAVICGRLLAGTTESAGQQWTDKHGQTWKAYRGMASKDALSNAGKRIRVEGVSGKVPHVGRLADTLNELADGIKTGMAYVGARNIRELRARARFIMVTPAAYSEGLPRI